MNLISGVIKDNLQGGDMLDRQLDKNKRSRKHEVLKVGQDGIHAEVSIFDLTELIGRHYPVNRITLRLIDALRPASFDSIEDETELEMMNLKFAKMKLTSKLSRFGFNESSFFEILNVNNDDKIPLYQLFSRLADKYSVYFSVSEQIAIRNALFPSARNEKVQESRTRLVILGSEKYSAPEMSPSRKDAGPKIRTVSNTLILPKADFIIALQNYMVRRQDFIDFTLTQYGTYLQLLTQ